MDLGQNDPRSRWKEQASDVFATTYESLRAWKPFCSNSSGREDVPVRFDILSPAALEGTMLR
jgi:hypothetical protein